MIRTPPAKRRPRTTTHCPSGHPYDGENLYFGSDGGRRCRICQRKAQQRYIQKKRARARER